MAVQSTVISGLQAAGCIEKKLLECEGYTIMRGVLEWG